MRDADTVLVTGAAGFIGSHLVDRLAAAGARVRCLARRGAPVRRPAGPSVEAWEGDYATGAGLREACAGAAAVFHLGGVTKALRASDYYSGNVAAVVALVRACADAGVPRLVHVSSLAAVGPGPDGTPLAEDAPCRPVSHYGRSKLEGERTVAGSAMRARAVIVRPPVVYGPRDTDVLHIFRAASRGWLPAIGRQERYFSLIYVKDLVEGLLAAARCPAAGGRTYHLAQADPLSWTGFFGAAAAAFGRRPRRLPVPLPLAWTVGLAAEAWARCTRQPGILSCEKIAEARCRYWTCDTTRARLELGFTPGTGLREGIEETIAWYRKAGWLK